MIVFLSRIYNITIVFEQHIYFVPSSTIQSHKPKQIKENEPTNQTNTDPCPNVERVIFTMQRQKHRFFNGNKKQFSTNFCTLMSLAICNDLWMYNIFLLCIDYKYININIYIYIYRYTYNMYIYTVYIDIYVHIRVHVLMLKYCRWTMTNSRSSPLISDRATFPNSTYSTMMMIIHIHITTYYNIIYICIDPRCSTNAILPRI